MGGDPERWVVLVDEGGAEIGRALRSDVHTASTPLHLAFSCHIVDPEGRTLLTRRALTKRTWPGVWTNSVCGHPGPGESIEDAVRRHAADELGLDLVDLRCELPHFRYRATDASGVVENELCPVYTARSHAEPQPDPREVIEYTWIGPADLAAAVRACPPAFSPWLVLQVADLDLYSTPGGPW